MSVLRKWAAAATALAICAAPVSAEAGIKDWVAAKYRAWFGPSQKAPPAETEEQPLPDLFPTEALVSIEPGRLETLVDGGKVTLIVRRRSSMGDRITIHWETIGQSAEAGRDFGAASGDLVLEPRQETGSIEIGILANPAYQAERTFTVRLSNPKNARLDQSESLVVIRNNRPPAPEAKPGQLICGAEALGSPPGVVGFEPVEIGYEVEGVVVCRNSAAGELTVSKAEVAGGQGSFSMAEDGCAGRTLSSGAQCRIEVTFSPTAPQPVKGRLLVQWRSLGKDQLAEIGLNGVGTEPPLPPRTRVDEVREGRRGKPGRLVLDPEAPPPIDPPQYRLSEARQAQEMSYKSIGIVGLRSSLPVRGERVITTDRYIPCVLETEIVSELPGGVVCVVESPVYGLDGRLILIPAGTRVEGDYQPLAKTGDTRLNVIWRRFRKPDNSSIYVQSGFQAMDVAGRTGMPGYVDTRWWEKYQSAIFLTGLSAAAAYAVPANNDRLATAQQTGSDGMMRIIQQQLEENFDLRPVTTVPSGSRLIIRPLVDLWFPEPDIIAPTGAPSPSNGASPRGARQG